MFVLSDSGLSEHLSEIEFQGGIDKHNPAYHIKL